MKTLNVQRLQLPDGTLLTIEGGSAEDTARFLIKECPEVKFWRQPGASAAPVLNQMEEPLPFPVWNFSPAQNSSSAMAVPVSNGEEPLPLPRLDFSQR